MKAKQTSKQTNMKIQIELLPNKDIARADKLIAIDFNLFGTIL